MISPTNVCKELSEHLDPNRTFEYSPYPRDPWTLQYFEEEQTNIEDILMFSKQSIQSLLGEVFLEEGRTLSAVYEGVIRALAMGRWKLKEVADLLYSRRLIDQPNPSRVRPYFNNMMSMDLVTRIPLHHKNRYKYMIKSPVMELGYLLDERYNFFDEDISRKRVTSLIKDKIPKHVELFFGELFSELYGGNFEYFYSSEFDIDFIITEGKEVLGVGEVKWSDNVSQKDIDRFLNRTEYLSGDRIFISKVEFEREDILCLTPDRLISMLRSGEIYDVLS